MTEQLFAGLDLGSTGIKLLVIGDNDAEVLSEQVSTPWVHGPGGTTEIDADALAVAIRGLLEAASLHIAASHPSGHVEALAMTGMGETGFVVDDDRRAVAAGFAWFDPRGKAEAAALPEGIQREFAGRTGLPLGAQVTIAKLAYLRSHGTRLDGRRWLNLPEFVAMSLGGEIALEHSLASRTGLVDQDTDEPWPDALAALGVDQSFLPPLRDAGTSWGTAGVDLPPLFARTRLTVAGHDHLVSAQASGSLLPDHYHVSIGTAEVLLRVVDEPLGYDARTRLVGSLINEVSHVVPGQRVLVAGVKSGLILRRVLQSVGVSDRVGRDALDAAVMELPYEGLLQADAIEVQGARNDDGVLKVAVRTDGVSPAELFGAALRHTNDEITILTEAIEQELPPARSSLLTGGWVGMRAVQRARARVLPHIVASPREQDTAFGAALVARRFVQSQETSPEPARAEKRSA